MKKRRTTCYNRALFSEYAQSLQEQDIVRELTTEFLDYPHLRIHAIVLTYWVARDCDLASFPISLVDEVLKYLAQERVDERTDLAVITERIAPQVLEMMLRAIKPEVFLPHPALDVPV